MLRAIVLYLLRWLEVSLDPDLQLRIDALNEKIKAIEAERVKLLAKVDEGEREIFNLGVILADDIRKRGELEDAIFRSKEETAKKMLEMDSLSDHDRLRLDI